ncbi:prephenate dehydrogenase/arogenate dehydrogenase family protein [Methanoplanus endosymbiosus]|uniref:Prephenate dehydrogenase/arogenate dehydrogenase family protein n=1 Tax=Methanoplanus endosymbiosus TaxID=33865 RepID=A0A9E7PL52_9EURY|nr:prephenate dehydrogenase/arogenate dehydrogenase family protein [Methanoplanus endosymbiosus]UUX91337.1 prephenate dehydrogenase/arogenate dehydrogenase family protein [Methanoplanus endosymbiosus]
MKVGIIGGTGGMGRLFAPLFERAGFSVIVSGRSTSISNRDIAEESDIVIISVPIHETISVIEEISPYLRADQILCDFTSVKEGPVNAMLKTEAEVLGLHPMFGPSVSSLSGQTIISVPARCRQESADILYNVFRDEDATVIEMDAGEHDRVMGVVQGLVHFATICVADAIRNSGISPEVIIPVMSPVYRIEMGIIGRILGQSPELYGDILMMNSKSAEMAGKFSESSGEMLKYIREVDYESFKELFEKNREFFSGYIPQATRDTDLVIDALAKSGRPVK